MDKDVALLWLDRINATIEFAILVPFALDFWALYKADNSDAVSLSAQWQYGLYCLWAAIYFAILDQWWSSTSAVIWLLGYVAKTYVVIKRRAVIPVSL